VFSERFGMARVEIAFLHQVTVARFAIVSTILLIANIYIIYFHRRAKIIQDKLKPEKMPSLGKISKLIIN
jgi:hypothetical protein